VRRRRCIIGSFRVSLPPLDRGVLFRELKLTSIGLHASISIHICHDYLDQETGEWAPNLQCFISRLASHPERLSNVYFNAILILRAVARAAPYLQAYDIGTAPVGRHLDDRAKALQMEDKEAKEALKEVLKLARSDEIAKGFDEGDFFIGEDATVRRSRLEMCNTEFSADLEGAV